MANTHGVILASALLVLQVTGYYYNGERCCDPHKVEQALEGGAEVDSWQLMGNYRTSLCGCVGGVPNTNECKGRTDVCAEISDYDYETDEDEDTETVYQGKYECGCGGYIPTRFVIDSEEHCYEIQSDGQKYELVAMTYPNNCTVVIGCNCDTGEIKGATVQVNHCSSDYYNKCEQTFENVARIFDPEAKVRQLPSNNDHCYY